MMVSPALLLMAAAAPAVVFSTHCSSPDVETKDPLDPADISSLDPVDPLLQRRPGEIIIVCPHSCILHCSSQSESSERSESSLQSAIINKNISIREYNQVWSNILIRHVHRVILKHKLV